MSKIKIESRNTDYDAAQALLDLQSNTKSERSNGLNAWSGSEEKEGIEKAAKSIWNCFNASDVEAPSNNIRKNFHVMDSPQSSRKRLCYSNEPNNTSTGLSIVKPQKASPSYFNDTNTMYLKQNNARNESYIKKFSQDNGKKQTREIGTQTDEVTIHPNIILMENTIKMLCEKIKALEAQIKVNNSEDYQSVGTVERPSSGADDLDDFSFDNEGDDPDYHDTTNDTSYQQKHNSFSQSFPDSNGIQTGGHVFSGDVLANYNINTKLCDRVPIGDGNATVPLRLLKHINWNSYSSATRKLLTAVFSRRVLATHSLTGKPSPAFPNKPAKKRLDPALVNDIVQTVVERCCVPENVVRTSITTKCADESKMLRTRQKNKKKRPSKKNRENIPPSTSESYSDDF